jgi:hypothetical protein
MFAPPVFSATTSSISWCTSFDSVGYANSPPSATMALAGFMKKNGGSRSGLWPISRACSE